MSSILIKPHKNNDYSINLADFTVEGNVNGCEIKRGEMYERFNTEHYKRVLEARKNKEAS